MNYSWIRIKLTELDDMIRQFGTCCDLGPNQFSNRSTLSESSAVEFRMLDWLERFRNIQSTDKLIGLVA
jgi:hypothetical protein